MKYTCFKYTFSKYVLSFLIFLIFFQKNTQNTLFAQNPNAKYAEIDTLLKSTSSFDAFKALQSLEKDFLVDTNKADYWIRHSKASYQFFKYENAKKSIEKAVKKEPKNDIAHFEKGYLYNCPHTRILETALSSLTTAINIQPKKGEYYYWRGIVNSQIKDHQNAEMDYGKAISLGFENPEMHVNLAITFAEKPNPDLDKAIFHTQKAIKFDKNFVEAYTTQSRCKMLKHDLKGACEDLKIANKLGYKEFSFPDSVCNGNEPIQMRFLAAFFIQNKNLKEAIKIYEKFLNNKTNIEKKDIISDDLLNKGYCHFTLKEYPKAEKDFLEALKMPNPSTDQLYDNLSFLYFKQEEWEKSVFYSSARINLRPSNTVAYLDRGTAYRELKKYKEAEIDFNKCLQLEPNFFRAFGYKAKLYLDMGKYKEAQDEAEKAIFHNKNYDYAYLMLGHAKYMLKNPDFCLAYQRAKELGNTDADIVLKKFCGKK